MLSSSTAWARSLHINDFSLHQYPSPRTGFGQQHWRTPDAGVAILIPRPTALPEVPSSQPLASRKLRASRGPDELGLPQSGKALCSSPKGARRTDRLEHPVPRCIPTLSAADPNASMSCTAAFTHPTRFSSNFHRGLQSLSSLPTNHGACLTGNGLTALQIPLPLAQTYICSILKERTPPNTEHAAFYDTRHSHLLILNLDHVIPLFVRSWLLWYQHAARSVVSHMTRFFSFEAGADAEGVIHGHGDPLTSNPPGPPLT